MRYSIQTLFFIASLATSSLQSSEQLTNRPIYILPVQDLQKYSTQTIHGDISVWDTGGKGKPVIFIHGNSSCKEIFSRQFESDVAKKYRFIAIDLPGHGQSENAKNPEKTYSMDGYADAIIEVIEKLKLENPAAIGWSLGGHVLLSAVAKSQKFSGVLITGTPPIEISYEGFQKGFLPLPKMMELFSKVELSKEEAVEFLTRVGFNIDLKKYPFALEAVLKTDGFARKYLSASIAKKIGGDQKALVESNDTPLCVVLGKDEKGVNTKYVIENVKYKNLFNNQIYLIENAGHAPFWEQPDQFNQILADFLSQNLKD